MFLMTKIKVGVVGLKNEKVLTIFMRLYKKTVFKNIVSLKSTHPKFSTFLS